MPVLEKDQRMRLLDDIPQGEANLKLIRRWLVTILMRIETLIEIEEAEREATTDKKE